MATKSNASNSKSVQASNLARTITEKRNDSGERGSQRAAFPFNVHGVQQNMLKNLALGTLLAAALAAQCAVADTKIGVVNPDRILRESAAAQAAQVKLEKEFASRQKSLSISARALKADVEKYQKRMAKLNKTQRMAEEVKLADRERSLQRQERELREDLNRRRNEELQAILMRSNDIIRDIARKNKYDLIVQEAVYVGPNVDITDQVIKALGK